MFVDWLHKFNKGMPHKKEGRKRYILYYWPDKKPLAGFKLWKVASCFVRSSTAIIQGLEPRDNKGKQSDNNAKKTTHSNYGDKTPSMNEANLENPGHLWIREPLCSTCLHWDKTLSFIFVEMTPGTHRCLGLTPRACHITPQQLTH